MRTQARALEVERWVLVVAAAAPPVAIWRAASDPFSLPKATVVVLAATVLVASAVHRWITERRLVLPLGPVTIAAAAFVVALVVATLASDQPDISVVGGYKRYGGLAFYGSCAVLLVGVVRSFDLDNVRRLAHGFLVGGGIAMTYGVMQWVGLEPYRWRNLYGDAVFSFLGNPNFAGAYAGIVAAFGSWCALDRAASPAVRALGGWVVLASALTAWGSEALQGFAAVALGVVVVGIGALLSRGGSWERLAVKAILGAGGIAVVAGVLGIAGAGPLGFLGEQRTLRLRRYYWDAAIAMFADQPITGVGPGRYGPNYRAFRSEEAALNSGDFTLAADAAHNVPLDMFAQGGLLVGGAYLAVVLLTGWCIVTGLRRLQGEDRLLLGAFAGAWAAYQLQSLVSIDVPPLAAAHWLLAGAIVAGARPPALRTFSWGVVASTAKKGRGPTKPRVSESMERAGLVAAGIVVIAGTWLATRPIRADIALADSRGAGGDRSAASAAADRSVELAPWESTYPFQKAVRSLNAGRTDEAAAALEEALERDPKGPEQIVTRARVADADGDVDQALALYERALEVEPHAADMKVEVATYRLENGDADGAAGLVLELTDALPDRADLWVLLARAYAADEQRDRAREALLRALDLEPENEAARELQDEIAA